MQSRRSRQRERPRIMLTRQFGHPGGPRVSFWSSARREIDHDKSKAARAKEDLRGARQIVRLTRRRNANERQRVQVHARLRKIRRKYMAVLALDPDGGLPLRLRVKQRLYGRGVTSRRAFPSEFQDATAG